MNTTCKRALLSLATAALLVPTAHATNGYFSHGYGMRAKAMAGAGIANPEDAIAAANNPAGMGLIGNRWDAGVDWFRPNRDTQIAGNGSLGTVNYSPNDAQNFLVPEFGYNRMINDRISVGVAVYGNGGMNTDYTMPIGLFGSTDAGVDLAQVFVAPTVTYRLNDRHVIGVSVNLAYQNFEAHGLQNFDNSTQSSAPGFVTNNGYDQSAGIGVSVGWLGELSDTVRVGAMYRSRTYMDEFDDYKGLFAEQGDFDIPETYGVGIAVDVNPNMTVAFDVTRINYSEVQSVGNPLGPAPGGALTNTLGTDGGAGFGWDDITVYKLGLAYRYSDSLTLRAGWNHGDQPIPSGETFFNLLAPGVIEDHVTLGATWRLNNGGEVTVAYMHALEKTVDGSSSIPAAFGAGEANLTMDQDSLGIAYGVEF